MTLYNAREESPETPETPETTASSEPPPLVVPSTPASSARISWHPENPARRSKDPENLDISEEGHGNDSNDSEEGVSDDSEEGVSETSDDSEEGDGSDSDDSEISENSDDSG